MKYPSVFTSILFFTLISLSANGFAQTVTPMMFQTLNRRVSTLESSDRSQNNAIRVQATGLNNLKTSNENALSALDAKLSQQLLRIQELEKKLTALEKEVRSIERTFTLFNISILESTSSHIWIKGIIAPSSTTQFLYLSVREEGDIEVFNQCNEAVKKAHELKLALEVKTTTEPYDGSNLNAVTVRSCKVLGG